jgi:hypothetical protein
MKVIATLCAALLAFSPVALAQDGTNVTGQTMDQSGQKGDSSPSTGSKEPGGSGNAAGQDGLRSPNKGGHGSSSGDPDSGALRDK